MNLRFLNTNPEFKIYQESESPTAFLYYKGIFDQPLGTIFRSLDSGKFPENLKGNFAFVFYNENRIIGAVDHLPTINLFYSRQPNEIVVSHIYRELNRSMVDVNPNYSVQIQPQFFWGGSVGRQTFNHAIQRLEAGTYFEYDLKTAQFTIRSYIDIFTHHIDNTITKGDIADIVEQIVEENTRDVFNLLWSSGTDSNCLLGFIRKLNRTEKCNLISLYSNTSVTDERPNCEYLANVYGLQARYLNVGDYIGISKEVLDRARALPIESDYVENLARTWDGFWWEPNIFQKYTALLDSQFTQYSTFTGEVGDQIFGSRFGKVITAYVAQKPNATGTEIGELFIRADAWRFKLVSTVHDSNWIDDLKNSKFKSMAWNTASQWCRDTWNKIDTDSDVINRSELLSYMYKGSHRIYNYSQLKNCSFIHPYSDYRLFHVIFKTPGHWKINNGKTRRLSLDIVKDYVDPGPWNWAKSGIAVPMAQKFKPENQKELVNVVRTRYQ